MTQEENRKAKLRACRKRYKLKYGYHSKKSFYRKRVITAQRVCEMWNTK